MCFRFIYLMSLQLAWGPINDPFLYIFFNCSVFGFSCRHIVAPMLQNLLFKMSLVILCVRKKKQTYFAMTSEYTVTHRVSGVCPQCIQFKCGRKCSTAVLMNTSSSASAILPFAASDLSVLYLWISCAPISRRSPVTFVPPQRLCFLTKTFLQGKNK